MMIREDEVNVSKRDEELINNVSTHQTVITTPHDLSPHVSEDRVMEGLPTLVKDEEPDVTCDIEDDGAGQSSELKSHDLVLYQTWGKPYACHSCGYTAARLGRLKDHIIRTHTEEKPYSCESCDYKARTRQDLTKHKISHTGEKPYSCFICDYRAGRTQQLKRHMKMHTDEKMYDCSFCQYRADQPGILKTHLRKHTGEKPFACNYAACDYSAARLDRLKDHIIRTHTEEKPYSCLSCDYKARTRKDLTRHNITHTGEKPYACQFCDYIASRAQQLKRHAMKRHVDEKL